MCGPLAVLLLVGCGAPILPSASESATPSQTSTGATCRASHCDTTTTPAVMWDGLRVAMRLPHLAASDSCQVSPSRPLPGITSILGDGPVAPSGTASIPLDQLGKPDASGQFLLKVVWVIDPARYAGPALVRGQRLNDGTSLLFKASIDAAVLDELQIAGPPHIFGGSPWPAYGSYTVLSAPGCYGYQVDGFGVQETIVFEVQ